MDFIEYNFAMLTYWCTDLPSNRRKCMQFQHKGWKNALYFPEKDAESPNKEDVPPMMKQMPATKEFYK